MDRCRINTENRLEHYSTSTAESNHSQANQLALPLDRSQRISGIWNKTVAFFTKGYIGKTITSKSYLFGRKLIGGIAGQRLFGLFGSFIGKSIGNAAIPTFAISISAMFAINPNFNRLGLSKAAFAAGLIITTIAMQILFSEYLEDAGSLAGNYLFGSIGHLAGEMLLAYITEPPKISLEEYAMLYTMKKGSSIVMQTFFPCPVVLGKIRDNIFFHGVCNADTIKNVYIKASAVMNSLKNQDIAEATQAMLEKSGKFSFFGASILIALTPRFMRLGMRSFNKYVPLTQTSPKVLRCQETLRAAFASSDKTAIQKAKKNLLQAIKQEMKKHFTMIGIANGITGPTFDHFLASKLDRLNIADIEEHLLGFVITDDVNEAYSKALAEIHTRCFLAFTAVQFFNKNKKLPKECEVLFFENIVQVFMDHYTRVAPNSKILKYTNSILSTAVEKGVRFIISAPTSNQEIFSTEETNTTPPPLTEVQKNAFKTALILIVSMFVMLCRFLYNFFIHNTSNLQRESTVQIIEETVTEIHSLINYSNSILLEEEELDDDARSYIMEQTERTSVDSEETDEDFFSVDTDSLIFFSQFEEESSVITGRITEITEDNDEEEKFFTPAETKEELENMQFEDTLDISLVHI